MFKGVFFQRLIPLVTVCLLLVFTGIADTAEAGLQKQGEPMLTHLKRNIFDLKLGAVGPERGTDNHEGISVLKTSVRPGSFRLFLSPVISPPGFKPGMVCSHPDYVPRGEEHLPCPTSPLLFPVHGFW